MKIIICGAGQVGGQIARHLAREEGANHVTVIDHERRADPAHHRRLRRERHRRLRLAPGRARAGRRPRRRHGDRRHPVRRGQHGRLPGGELDLLGAAQDRPAARRRPTSTPIYSDLYRSDHLPIDVVISPEFAVADAVMQRLAAPAAFDIEGFLDGEAQLVGIALDGACAVLNTPLRQLSELFSTLRAVVVGVRRGERLFVPEAERPALRRRPDLRDHRHRGPAAGDGDLRQDPPRRSSAC